MERTNIPELTYTRVSEDMDVPKELTSIGKIKNTEILVIFLKIINDYRLE